jgi:hypothetical protein
MARTMMAPSKMNRASAPCFSASMMKSPVKLLFSGAETRIF